MSENVLRVENVTMQFGGVVAVDNMNLEVNRDEIVSLIGPNGAGKTTAFNVITGVYAPTNGSVYFQGNKIIENHPQGKMKKLYKGEHAGDYKHVLQPTPDKVTKLGIARTLLTMKEDHPARGARRQAHTDGAAVPPEVDTHRPVLHSVEWLAQVLLGRRLAPQVPQAGPENRRRRTAAGGYGKLRPRVARAPDAGRRGVAALNNVFGREGRLRRL